MPHCSQIIQRRSLRVGRCQPRLPVIGMPGISDRHAGISDRHAPESVIGMPRITHHSLANLLAALQDRGVVVTPDCASLVKGLNAQHERHALRYTALVDDGRPTFMPPPALVFEMLDELLMLTRLSTQGV